MTQKQLSRKYGCMKTTLNLQDDLLRQAKARAALRGQPLSRYIEEGLRVFSFGGQKPLIF